MRYYDIAEDYLGGGQTNGKEHRLWHQLPGFKSQLYHQLAA